MKALITFEIPDRYKDMELYYKDGWVYARNIDPDYEFTGLYELTKCIKIQPLPKEKYRDTRDEIKMAIDYGWNSCLAALEGKDMVDKLIEYANRVLAK